MQTLLNYCKVPMPAKHVLLISHMRSNSSVLSHLIGSNPEVSGYYEMHMGYYSWKSLYRQKLKFMQSNPDKALTPVFYDKVLHNEHKVKSSVVDRDNVRAIFMVRDPLETVSSLVKLYQKVEPNHECASYQGAQEYYLERLAEIKKLYLSLDNKDHVLCLEANQVRNETEATLAKVSKFIGLKQPLSSNYEIFDKTGSEKFGDSSTNIYSGKVIKSKALTAEQIDAIPNKGELTESYNDLCATLGVAQHVSSSEMKAS